MQLFYKEYPGPGAPLIMMHGLFGMLDNWHNIARQLAENYRVFLLDLRNHGQSPHSPEMSYPLMAADLSEFMEARKLDKACVLGHSMGGKAAMEFALSYPGKCEKAIVVDMAPVAYKPGHDTIFKALFQVDLHNGNKTRGELEKEMAAFVPESAVRQFLLKSLAREGDGFVWKFNLDVLYRNYDAVIAPVTGERSYDGEVLFVRGSRSDYVQEAHLPEIKRLFPQFRLETIAGAGHWVHAEKPAELVQAIKNFLG
jgi:esterase